MNYHVDQPLIRDYFRCLAVCHTVVPYVGDVSRTASDDDPGAADVDYQAESPDEGALVLAAKCMGFKLLRREVRGSSGKQVITVRELDEDVECVRGGLRAQIRQVDADGHSSRLRTLNSQVRSSGRECIYFVPQTNVGRR